MVFSAGFANHIYSIHENKIKNITIVWEQLFGIISADFGNHTYSIYENIIKNIGIFIRSK